GSSLPPGLTLLSGASLRSTDTPGGTVLAGVPTTSGQYAFDLILTDAAGTQLRRTFTLTVSAINLLSGMRNPTVGTAYAQRFTAVGGSLPYTFTMTPSSLGFDMLPPGLTFTSDGLLSGTPTGTGSFGFLLRAQDAAGRAYSRTFSFQSTTASGLFVSTGNPTDGSVGVGRSFSLFELFDFHLRSDVHLEHRRWESAAGSDAAIDRLQYIHRGTGGGTRHL